MSASAASFMYGSRQTANPLAILCLRAAPPVPPDMGFSDEINAIRRQGHRIVPLYLSGEDTFWAKEAAASDDALFLHAQSAAAAAAFAGTRPRGMAEAMQFANCIANFSPVPVLQNAVRAAAASWQKGCRHIHAADAAGAAIAIAAAMIAETTCSFAVTAPPAEAEADLMRTWLSAASVAFAADADIAARLRALSPGATVAVLHDGAGLDSFVPGPGASDNGRLLMAMHFTGVQELDPLFEALSMLAPARRPCIDIAGDGPQRLELERRAIESGWAEQLRFLGNPPQSWLIHEVPRYRGFLATAADCDLRMLKQALSMGLPIIAARLPRLAGIVTPACGRLVEADDAAAIAGAIEYLASIEPAIRRSIGAAGRLHFLANFTLAGRVEHFTAAIRSARRSSPESLAVERRLQAARTPWNRWTAMRESVAHFTHGLLGV